MKSKTPENKAVTVISLGGSIMVPDLPDPIFIKAFVEAIKERVGGGRRFVIITGGGKTCRNYQKALAEVRPVSHDDNDWLGIYVTRLNAQLIRLAFEDLAWDDIWIDFEKAPDTDAPVIVGAGAEPGHSTDFDAILVAELIGAQSLVNVSNIDYVYTADPRKDPNAQPIKEISWADLIAMLPKEWSPGLSAPFDPIAARKAAELNLTVSIVNGGSLENVLLAIDGKTFTGTVITG